MKVAELSDPEISLHRTGLLEDGRPYLVLDLVEGPTLEALLQARGRLEEAACLALGLQVVQALGRMVQCDIGAPAKPS